MANIRTDISHHELLVPGLVRVLDSRPDARYAAAEVAVDFEATAMDHGHVEILRNEYFGEQLAVNSE